MSNKPFDHADDEIFLGRVEEQNRFRDALHNILRESSIIERVKVWVTEKDPDEMPYIFLLYGEGGMGKSRLAHRLRSIASNEATFKNHFRSIWLDWEKRKALDLRLAVRDSVSPETIFEHIYSVFRDEGFGRDFDPYEKALKNRAQAETKVAQALNRLGEDGDRYAMLREIGGKGLAWLVGSGLVLGAPVSVPEELMSKAFGSILGSGAEALRQARESATMLLRSFLNPDEFDLFTLPHEILARRLSDGIRASASYKPILFVLDTYEIADCGDTWLRVVMKRAGPRILWVVAGRNNLADSRKYGQQYFTGYRADFLSDRLRVFPLGEFSVSDVIDYFAWRESSRPIDIKSAEAIHQATLGIPLAVREAAAIWKAGASLEDIVSDIPLRAPREQIVKVMTERFLLHCFDDPNHPDDRLWLYALALAYRPDPDLLSCVIQSEDLERDLSELERRHSFVFVTAMRLHDAVAAFLREYLMYDIRRRSKEIRSIHERAITYLDTRRRAREDSSLTIEEQVADERWTSAILGLVHHSFWLDEDQGWAQLMPAFPGGLIYDRDFARALIEMVEPFEASLTQAGKRRYKVLQRGLPYYAGADEQSALLEEFDAAARNWPDDSCAVERQVILGFQHGQLLYRQKRYIEALRFYEEAQRGLSDRGKVLKKNLANALEDVGFALGFDDRRYALPNKEAETVYKQALSLSPGTGNWHRRLGRIQRALGKFDEALQHALKSVEIEPKNPDNHQMLGLIYGHLGSFENATDELQIALQLNPKHAASHTSLGIVYSDLGRYDEAIVELQIAIQLNPKTADAHTALGNVYKSLGRYDEAVAELQIAMQIDPKEPASYNNLADIYMEKGRLADARQEFLERIKLRRDNIFAPSVSLGVISRHQGLPDSEEYFMQALANWETAWRQRAQTTAALLENKAIALLCIGNKDEAMKTLSEAIAQILPGDIIDIYRYTLLQSAPSPPEGVEQMIVVIKEAQARRQK